MDGVPAGRGEWHDGGALGSRQDGDDLVEALGGHVHQHIFLVLSGLDGFDAEEEVVEDGPLLGRESLVGDEQCLAVHGDLDLAEVVAHEGRTAADDVEDGVGQADSRGNLHGTRDDVDLGVNTFLLKVGAEDGRIAGGYLLALEPLHTGIVDGLGDGQREAALAEAQTTDDIGFLATFHELIFAHDTQVGHTRGHGLRNVVVAEIEHLHGEVGRLDKQGALA